MSYRTVHLAINLGAHAASPLNPGGNVSDCNSGGSTWCYSPTRGCGAAGATCFGTSSSLESIEAMVSLPADRVEAFQRELQALMVRFATK